MAVPRLEVPVPDGVCGSWRIETFTIGAASAALFNLRVSRGRFGRAQYVVPGTFKRLVRGLTVVMSNTPMEVESNREVIARAEGRVVLCGLGLGMVLTALLAKPMVREVVVIEKERAVLTLVMPSFAHDPRVLFVEHDALTYRPPRGARYDVVWHDIWESIASDNLPEMSLLKRRWGHKTQWQGCWMERECRLLARSERTARGGWRYA